MLADGPGKGRGEAGDGDAGRREKIEVGKKIAVLVRDRQEEGLRMAVGLTLKDDSVDVYVLDRKLEESENNQLNLETLDMIDAGVYTNFKGNGELQFMSTEEMAGRLTGYDSVLPY